MCRSVEDVEEDSPHVQISSIRRKGFTEMRSKGAEQHGPWLLVAKQILRCSILLADLENFESRRIMSNLKSYNEGYEANRGPEARQTPLCASVHANESRSFRQEAA